MSNGRVKCLKCGYSWTPKVDQPVSCANRKCRRKILYEDFSGEDPEDVIPVVPNDQGQYEVQTIEDPEDGDDQTQDKNLNEDLNENHDHQKGEGSLEIPEDPLDLTEDHHPQSSDEISQDEIHQGTGLRLKTLDQMSNPSNPSGLYTNQNDIKNPSSGRVLEESPIKIPDPEPSQIKPILGGVFEDEEHQESASQEVSQFLKKHKGSLENKIAQTGVNKASGGLLGGIDVIWVDGAKMIFNLILMKLNENKQQNERERVKKLIQDQKKAEDKSHPQDPQIPKSQVKPMRTTAKPDPKQDEGWGSVVGGHSFDPDFMKDPKPESRGSESQEIKTPSIWEDHDKSQGDPERDQGHKLNNEIEPKQTPKEDDLMDIGEMEGLEVSEDEMKEGLSQILNILGMVPEGQVVEAINEKQNLIKTYEGMILGFMTPETLSNLKGLFILESESLNGIINAVAQENPDNVNLQHINSPRGRDLIHYNLNELEGTLKRLGL